MQTKKQFGPLAGLRVLEMGSLIAGPFTTRLMAEFGADVVKIEPPSRAAGQGGDPLRKWRKLHNGTSLWWYVQARNKRSITLDLKHEKGREIVLELVKHTDIFVENFRPGTLEKLGLDYPTLQAVNPGLILVRISGFGQDGPYKDRPGFGAIGESMGGLRYVTGYPDRPPVRVGVSIGDSITALHAVMGALMALRHRDKTGEGQIVDVALYESVFNMMESLVPEYGMNGFVRERSGSALPGIVPSNTYLCGDGQSVVIGGNSDPIYRRLMAAIGRSDLAEDSRLQSNDGRVAHTDLIDGAIGEWCATKTRDQVLTVLGAVDVPVSEIYSVADMFNDAQFKARGMIERHQLQDGQEIAIPAVTPKLSKTPGATQWLGPVLGEHTAEVLSELGFTLEQLDELTHKKVI